MPAILAGALFGAGAMFGGAGAVVVAAAEPSSDIPGVALPGPVAAGRLGGAIYDVVYRFSVAPGHVIVASLTGAAGTDFDLYLFDSSATTVLSTVGLLKKSAGPTSTESISRPSPLGGTYYIDLNGSTVVEGDYRLALQTVPDETPPTVSMVLAGGQTATNQLIVPVTLHATDDLSGVADVALSDDGSTWAAWQPYEGSTTWTFSPGDGERTLWAKVRNGVGLESAPTNATVTIDTDPPSAIGVEPVPGSSVAGLRPPFSVTFDEAMDPTSWTDLGLIVQSATGTFIPGQYAYDPASRTGTFVPGLSLQPGGTYVVTLGDARDVAGNRIALSGSWTITPLAQAEMDVQIEPKAVIYGGSARLDLTLSGAPVPAAVEVEESSTSSGGFVPSSTFEVVNGRLSFVVTPNVNTTYRLRYAGAFGVSSAEVDAPVLVRRSVGLVGRSSSTVSGARVGSSVKLVAAVGPAAAGVSVSFRLYRFDAVRRVWVYAGSHGRSTDVSGRASMTWAPAAPGSWYWRASVASTADFANNVSPVYRWSISR